MIKLLSTPVRWLLRFPVVQFGVVIFLILVMQAADEGTLPGDAFAALDRLVDSSIRAVSALFTVKSFTKSWLTFGFMIGYVYLACWLIFQVARIGVRLLLDFVGRQNILWLRNAIARERGIGAYRAWLPLETIRPAHIPQPEWEERYAWPRDNQPPYPPLLQRALHGTAIYLGAFVLLAVLLQAFTPVPVLTWLAHGAEHLVGF